MRKFLSPKRCQLWLGYLWLVLTQIASTEQLQFQSLREDAGISSKNIAIADNTIVQDSQGFLWFGTQDGLNRFDGYTTKIYRHNRNNPNSLSHNLVTTLYEDSSGTLWIGTNKGLNRFDPKTESFTHYYHNPETNTSLSSSAITSIVEARDGQFWIGTLYNGLNFFDVQTGVFVRYQHNPKDSGSLSDNKVGALYMDRTKTLWVGTAKGLNAIAPGEKQFTRYQFDHENPRSLGNNSINIIFEDRIGWLWIGTTNGISRLDPARKRFDRLLYYPDDPTIKVQQDIQSILEDVDGDIWVGIYNHGLVRYKPSNQQWTHYRKDPSQTAGLCSDKIAMLYQDRLERIWIGSLDNQGFCYFSPHQRQFGFQSLVATNTALLKDQKGAIWVGTFGNGLAYIYPNTQKRKFFRYDKQDPNSLSNDKVTALFEDAGGTLWIGTFGNGLNRWNSNTGKFERFTKGPRKILALAGDDNNKLWIGSFDQGLSEFDIQHRRFSSRNDGGKIDHAIITLYYNKKNMLWGGSSKGLIRYHPETESYDYYRQDDDPDQIINSTILSLYEDAQGHLWMGGSSGWLEKFDPVNNRFNQFQVLGGDQAEGTIYGLLGDSRNRIWMSTNRGISVFDPKTQTVKTYQLQDGLQANDFHQGAFHKSHTGELLFGGSQGFNHFHPEKITDKPTTPTLLFTDFLLDNQSVAIHHNVSGEELPKEQLYLSQAIYATKHLALTYREKFFSFEFAAINAIAPNDIQYAYKLEGWDDHWLYTDYKKRSASYTNIDAGKYILRVKAIDKNGIWGETSASIAITISPPFWKTPWAYGVYLLLMLATVIGFIQLRTRSLRNRTLALEQTVQSRTQEIVTQKQTIETLMSKKDEFFANISHEFRTPLTLITGTITKLLKENRSHNVRTQLEPALINVHRLLRMVDQLLDLTRFDQTDHAHQEPIDLSQTITMISASLKSLLEERQLTLTQHIKPGVVVAASTDGIDKIIINLLSNAIKYTPKGGAITLTLSTVNQKVLLNVEDNGPGIPNADHERIFQRFVRLETPQHEPVPGAGIGLALVKQFVLNYGGQIEVSNRTTGGTRFSIQFPLLDKTPDPNRQQESLLSAPVSQELQTLKARPTTTSLITRANNTDPNVFPQEKDTVLIVEDHADMCQFLAQALEPYYLCHLASDGLLGIRLALEIVPNLIITDLMMPNKSGFELANVVRSDMRTSHIPIILLTAKVDNSSRQQAWKSEIDDYVEKPFNTDELLLRCENLLSIRRLLSMRLNAQLQHVPSHQILAATKKHPTISDRDQLFINNLRKLITKYYQDTNLNAKLICTELAMSESQLQRKIKALLGQSVPDYIRTFRLQRGAQMLKDGTINSTDTAFSVGFSSSAYFTKCFKAHYGITPKVYQAQHQQ